MGRQVAVKVPNEQRDDNDYGNEYKFLKVLNGSDHIIPILATIPSLKAIVLPILEYGDLMTFIRTRSQEIRSRAMPVSVLLHIATHLAIAIQQMSDKSVCSNDIKPENVFLLNDPMVSTRTNANPLLLADFGLAAFSDQESYTMAGTTEYASPEIASIVLSHRSQAYMDCKASDVWATAAVIHELYTTRLPFYPVSGRGDRDHRLFKSIVQGKSFMGTSRRDRGYQIPHIVARVLEEDSSVDIAALVHELKAEKQRRNV